MGLYLGSEKVKIYLGGTTHRFGIFSAETPKYEPDEPVLSTYSIIEYIEATGTQYIDTGITGHDGLSVEFNFEALSRLSADNSTIIGCTNGSNQRMYLTLNNSSAAKPFLWELGASNYYVLTDWSLSYCELNTKYHVNISWTKASSVLTIDGKDVIPLNNTLNFDDNNTNVFLFARNKGTSIDKYSHAKLYDLKMYDNGTLVRNFIPALRNSDNAIGLYDTVTDAFFTNAGSGSFVAGNIIV